MVDKPILVSAAMDGTIRFWDTVTQKNTLVLQYKVCNAVFKLNHTFLNIKL